MEQEKHHETNLCGLSSANLVCSGQCFISHCEFFQVELRKPNEQTTHWSLWVAMCLLYSAAGALCCCGPMCFYINMNLTSLEQSLLFDSEVTVKSDMLTDAMPVVRYLFLDPRLYWSSLRQLSILSPQLLLRAQKQSSSERG